VSESNLPKPDEATPSPSSPDNLVKDLEVRISESDQSGVVGGRKAGKGQQDYLVVKLVDAG
jgi:hypothetical protein